MENSSLFSSERFLSHLLLLKSKKEMKPFTKEQKQEVWRQYRALTRAEMKQREYGGAGYSQMDVYHRDYSRILYSSSFRRLQGKMQILGIESTAFFRNRLTHSLEVSQIAHSIAVNIGKECSDDKHRIYQDDIYVIDAAALAHDIGHPAFGHKGERVLDELAKKQKRRFEGNAQNFRVLRTLEKKEPKILGLNLTNRTLMAINKYIIKETQTNKKFMFKEDFDYLDDIRGIVGLRGKRTLDAQIIELADDIAYSVHDLEDGLAFRYFSIDELLYLIKLEDAVSYNQLNKLVMQARKYASGSESYKTIQEYSQVFRKRLTTRLTDLFVNDVIIAAVDDEKAEKHGTELGQWELQLNKYKNLCKVLSEIIFKCVTRDSTVSLYEKRGEVVLKYLYDVFSDDKINEDGKLLPPDYRPRKGYNLYMGAIDYLAGMMDTYAISRYEELSGRLFSSIEFYGVSSVDDEENN